MVIYIGNVLFGVRWRNWKLLTKEIGEGYGITNIAYPSVYNLLIDPKEEEPEKFSRGIVGIVEVAGVTSVGDVVRVPHAF